MAEEAIILWSGCITWLWSNQISVCPFVKTTIREQNKANWLAQSNLPRESECGRSFFPLQSSPIAKDCHTSQPVSHALLSISHFIFFCHYFKFHIYFSLRENNSTEEQAVQSSDQLSAGTNTTFWYIASPISGQEQSKMQKKNRAPISSNE